MAVSNGIELQNVSVNSFYVYPFGTVVQGASLTASSAGASVDSLFYGGKASVTASVEAQFSYIR